MANTQTFGPEESQGRVRSVVVGLRRTMADIPPTRRDVIALCAEAVTNNINKPSTTTVSGRLCANTTDSTAATEARG